MPSYFIGNPYYTGWITIQHEFAADTFATKVSLQQGNVQGVREAYFVFAGQGPYSVPGHPPGMARAQNIQNVAAAMGVRIP